MIIGFCITFLLCITLFWKCNTLLGAIRLLDKKCNTLLDLSYDILKMCNTLFDAQGVSQPSDAKKELLTPFEEENEPPKPTITTNSEEDIKNLKKDVDKLINLISPIERAFPRINELVFNLENRLDAHKNAIEDLGHKFMTLKERDGEKEDRLWGLESELRFYINKKEKSGAKKK